MPRVPNGQTTQPSREEVLPDGSRVLFTGRTRIDPDGEEVEVIDLFPDKEPARGGGRRRWVGGKFAWADLVKLRSIGAQSLLALFAIRMKSAIFREEWVKVPRREFVELGMRNQGNRYRMLLRLERLGLIEIERRGPPRLPLVRLLALRDD